MNKSTLCIGEILIDFFCNDVNTSLKDGTIFIKKAGGAPANVSSAIAKLGGHAYFLGKVGADPFGQFLEETLSLVGVHTDFLMKDPVHPTTLAYVSLQEDGQRDFVFNRGADEHVTYDEIPLEKLSSMKIIHFGSATALLSSPFQQTYKELLVYAKNHGHFISFDPNFRSDLWREQEEQFRKLVLECIPFADFLKVSDEELTLLTKETELHKATGQLHTLGASCIAVTLGKKGTFLSFKGECVVVPSIDIQAVDTTGAGDAFVGGVLFQLSKIPHPKSLSIDEWQEMIHFGNKVGAIVCEKMGAIESLPTLEEVLLR